MSLGRQDSFVHGLHGPVLLKMPLMKTSEVSWKKSLSSLSPNPSS